MTIPRKFPLKDTASDDAQTLGCSPWTEQKVKISFHAQDYGEPVLPDSVLHG